MSNKTKKALSAAAWFAAAVVTVLAVWYKIGLVDGQMVQLTSYASIDDTLMYKAAVSAANGEWLGEYSWIALGKHMFFSVWLGWLSNMGIPYLLGGQCLYIAACVVAAWAVMPLFKHKQWSAAVFAVLCLSPYSWAEFTLRVYRDNIFPSLCLLFFAGILGMALRFRENPWKSVGFALVGGLGLGTAWITREDGIWLLPFAVCAVLTYLIIVLLQKSDKKEKLKRILLPVVALAVCCVTIGAYCLQNYNHYGRFVVSDFTSSEFEDAVGALLRCDTDGPHDKKILVCKHTRDKVAAVCPLYAEIEEVFNGELVGLYNGYGFGTEEKEFNAGGFYWALRIAAAEAGYYEDAATAREFYRNLADQINQACDDGLIECKNHKISTTVMPWHSEYLQPTLAEFGNSVDCLLGFEQTSGLASMSDVAEGEGETMQAFLHQEATLVASPDTGLPMLSPDQRDEENQRRGVTAIYRSLLTPMLIVACVSLVVLIGLAVREILKKEIGLRTMQAVMLLGVLLSVLLRVALISYVEAVSFQVGTYLLYLSSACPLLLLFAAAGTLVGLELLVCAAVKCLSKKKTA